MKNKIIISLLFLLILFPAALFAMTAEEIIRNADNMQIFKTSEARGKFKIKDRFGVKEITFNSWARGTDESLIEFTSKAEKGQKILRSKDEIYLFYPDADEIIRMQGSMLRQSMMGLDISYEDMTGGKDRAAQYNIILEDEENINGIGCYVLNMTAKVRTVPYPKEKLWIDKKTFLIWKAEYYTKSNRLLKVIETLNTKNIDGRTIAVTTKMVDKMKTNTETTIFILDIKIDIPIDDAIFSLKE